MKREETLIYTSPWDRALTVFSSSAAALTKIAWRAGGVCVALSAQRDENRRAIQLIVIAYTPGGTGEARLHWRNEGKTGWTVALPAEIPPMDLLIACIVVLI